MPKTEDPYESAIVRNIRRGILWFIFIVIFFIVIIGSFYIIEAGERGVLLTFGNPDAVPKAEGLHFKIPIVQKVVKMDIKTQKYETPASSASKDLQIVSTQVTVNYRISPEATPNLYQSVGLSYQDKVIQPAVQEVVKAATAQYTAEELITKRPQVKDDIDARLTEMLAAYDIIVQDVLITNFDFSASFNAAIEAKVTAEQDALAAKNKLAQVEYEAQQRITQAEGEAKAIEIQARAIQSQGGKEYVQLQAIQRWDGALPIYNGGGAVPFINIGDIGK